MELLGMGPKNQKLQKMVTSKCHKHQVNKIVLKIMMINKRNLKADNNPRNQKSVETRTL